MNPPRGCETGFSYLCVSVFICGFVLFSRLLLTTGLSATRRIRMAVAAQDLPEVALAFLPVDPVLFLVLARELIVRAGDDAQPVTGQPAPAFPHAAAQLLPLAFEAIPVHIQILGSLNARSRNERHGMRSPPGR